MLAEYIKVGDRIEISNKKDNKKAKDLVYISQVENVIRLGNLVVHVPISYGQLVKLKTEVRYFFLFFTEKGMIRFETQVTGIFKENNFYFMRISLLSNGERVQRREFFRFSSMLPLKFSLINEENLEAKMPQCQGIIKDISGGGLRFVSNEALEENAKLKCLIGLNEDVLMVIGKVLHKQYFSKSAYKYQYRVVFVGILPKERERIVRYIFNEQRKVLRKTFEWSDKNEWY